MTGYPALPMYPLPTRHRNAKSNRKRALPSAPPQCSLKSGQILLSQG